MKSLRTSILTLTPIHIVSIYLFDMDIFWPIF